MKRARVLGVVVYGCVGGGGQGAARAMFFFAVAQSKRTERG